MEVTLHSPGANIHEAVSREPFSSLFTLQVFTDANSNVNACHDINTGLRFYLPLSTPARNCATDSDPVIISPLSTLLV
jgi:hypothetical protein